MLMNYFEKRLHDLKRQLQLNSVSLYQRDFNDNFLFVASTSEQEPKTMESSKCWPVVFDNIPLGTLFVDGLKDSDRARAEGFAQQLACLWRLPQTDVAIELDQKVEALQERFEAFQWCGIYRLVEHTLYVTAFRGDATPHAIIPKNQGICGAAVTQNKTLNIEDVSKDPRYLSCDFRAKSELVVPIRNASGVAIAEIDIDSHRLNAFTPSIISAVEEAAREVTPLVLKLGE